MCDDKFLFRTYISVSVLGCFYLHFPFAASLTDTSLYWMEFWWPYCLYFFFQLCDSMSSIPALISQHHKLAKNPLNYVHFRAKTCLIIITGCMKLPLFCHLESEQLFLNCPPFVTALVPGLFLAGNQPRHRKFESCCHFAVTSKYNVFNKTWINS